jgi:hypothetical protein
MPTTTILIQSKRKLFSLVAQQAAMSKDRYHNKTATAGASEEALVVVVPNNVSKQKPPYCWHEHEYASPN